MNLNIRGALKFFIIALLMTSVTKFLFASSNQSSAINEKTQHGLSAIALKIGNEVDSILSQFQIDLKKVRKKTYNFPNTNLYRIERRATILDTIDPLPINQALNIMARRYNGRAVGSENLKESTVTIHIKINNFILETIILKYIENKTSKRKK